MVPAEQLLCLQFELLTSYLPCKAVWNNHIRRYTFTMKSLTWWNLIFFNLVLNLKKWQIRIKVQTKVAQQKLASCKLISRISSPWKKSEIGSYQKWWWPLTSYNRQQPSPLLYSIGIWPARNSRLTQRETNHYITRCTSELAWPNLAGSSPGQLVIDHFAQHQ